MPPPATFIPVTLQTLPSKLVLPNHCSDPSEGLSPSLDSQVS